MKKIFILFSMPLFINIGLAQEQGSIKLTTDNQEYYTSNGYVKCMTIENEERLAKKNPKRLNTDEFEHWMTKKVSHLKNLRNQGKTIIQEFTIPVVIHIIHNGDPIGSNENISEAQALSQIQVMNEDYRRITGSRGGNNTTGLAVDIGINFCIAGIDPNGNTTNGIVRHQFNDASYTISTAETIKAQTIWDPTKYLNMWVFNFKGGLLGYAQFPTNSTLNGIPTPAGAANTDGVTATYNAFGTIDLDDGSFDLLTGFAYGRTMTHEVGHWLGLRHIWGDGDCTVDDYCDDTPVSEKFNSGCPTIDSCTSLPGNDMVQNYMDYTNDDCMDTFTQDQKDRMVIVMTNSPRRKELTNSNTCNSLSTTTFSNDLVKLYPNPAKSVINLKCANGKLPSRYEIYDVTGRFISSKIIHSTADLRINTATFNNGLYFLKIEIASNNKTLKFLKE